MKSRYMKVVAAAVMVVTFSAPVFAADMPQRTQAPVYKAVAPSDPWTGCYAGGNVGGAWTTSHDVDVSIIGGDFGSRTASGVVGGGQIGCDYRSGNWVAGIRGLFDVADLNASNVSPINPLVSSGSHFPWFATASGRLGYLVTPATLVYATGGAAWIRSEFSNNAGAPNTLDVTRSGWLAGGGVEFMFAQNWSVFAEYNHFDLGTKTATASAGYLEQSKEKADVAMLGINFRFGSR